MNEMQPFDIKQYENERLLQEVEWELQQQAQVAVKSASFLSSIYSYVNKLATRENNKSKDSEEENLFQLGLKLSQSAGHSMDLIKKILNRLKA